MGVTGVEQYQPLHIVDVANADPVKLNHFKKMAVNLFDERNDIKDTGTTVELWFPAAEASAAVVTERAHTTPGKRKDIRPLTVLVVDDDPLVLTNMAAMLEDLGHSVFEASSALEALSILEREGTIELVLTDQAMPRMTGAELIAKIKSGWPSLPVILATGFAELPTDLDPLQVTLAKPFLQYDLDQAVHAAIEDPKTRRVVRFRERR